MADPHPYLPCCEDDCCLNAAPIPATSEAVAVSGSGEAVRLAEAAIARRNYYRAKLARQERLGQAGGR